jgi:hypothetical protein
MIYVMVRGLKSFQTVTATMGSMSMESLVVRVSSGGKTVRSMMANGKMALSTAMASGTQPKGTAILASGSSRKHTGMVSIPGEMATVTKANGKWH